MSETESGFKKGLGGGCGLVFGILLALFLIPLVAIMSCSAMVGGCFLVAPAVDVAQEAVENTREQSSQGTAAAPVAMEAAEPEMEVATQEAAAEVIGPEPAVSAEDIETPMVEAESEPEPQPEIGPVVKKNPALRIWTDSTGGFQVEAEFVSASMGQVKLRKGDGSEVTMPIDRLSEADQEWIRERARK